MQTIKISDKLHAAIQNYFLKKYHDESGFFAIGEKEPAIEQIKQVAEESGLVAWIVPGLVQISFGQGRHAFFDAENYLDGGFFDNDSPAQDEIDGTRTPEISAISKFFSRKKMKVSHHRVRLYEWREDCQSKRVLKINKVPVTDILLEIKKGKSLQETAEKFNISKVDVEDAVGFSVRCVLEASSP